MSDDDDDEDDDVDMMDKPNNASSSHTESVFTMTIAQDSKLDQIKNAFKKISNVYIHSIAIKQSKEIKDFHQAQYQTDYEQQSKIIRSFLAKQSQNQNKNKNASTQMELNRFSNIKYNMLKTVASPHLHRAIAPSKTKKKNKHNGIALSFDQKIEKMAAKKQKKTGPTPLKNKFKGLNLKKAIDDAAKQEDAPISNKSNTNEKKNANKPEKGGIAACFAKAASLPKSPPKEQKKTEEIVEEKAVKSKGDEITNFFESESKSKTEPKSKTKSTKKKKSQKKSGKKSAKKKKKKAKKKKKGSIKPAQKRKRG